MRNRKLSDLKLKSSPFQKLCSQRVSMCSTFKMCNTCNEVSGVGASCKWQPHFAYQNIIRWGEPWKISLTPCSSWRNHWRFNPKRFWRWCTALEITELLGFVRRRVFYRRELIRKWICFRPQTKWWAAPNRFRPVFETHHLHMIMQGYMKFKNTY
jgi:hypothetical protein